MNKSSGAFSVIVVGRGGDGSDGNTYNAGGGGGGGGIGVWDNTAARVPVARASGRRGAKRRAEFSGGR